MKHEYSTQLISVSAVGLWGVLSQAPEALKLLALTVAVAAGHVAVAWLRLWKERFDKQRERLERPTEPPPESDNGEVQKQRSETEKSGEDSRRDSEGQETHGVRS